MSGSYVGKAMALILVTAFTINHSHAQSGGGYAVTERGPDYKVLQKITVENGTNRVHKYTELATGMNYTNAYGQWQESKEEITLLPTGGAAATQGRHKVYFPADIYNGVLEVVTPDGRQLKSRPLGVSYDDGVNTVFIATLKHAQGYLTSSNTVTYRDAFEGIRADLVATYRRSGFECDLVFRQQPPTPEQYGLDPDSSTLQMVTEFFNTADPEQIPATSDEWYGLQDSTLKFGKLTMKQGKAFAIKSTNSQPSTIHSQRNSAPVYKRWLHLDNRTFLIEELPLEDLAEDLSALPLTASIKKPASSNLKFATNKRQFPPAHEFTADTNQILLASADMNKEPGVVLDYNEINTDQGTIEFQYGQTYLISGPANFGDGSQDGSSVVFDSGTVIKFTSNAGGINYDQLDASYPSDPASPAIFTSADDDSVGEVISGSTGNPSILTNVIFLPNVGNGSVLQNMDFYYAGAGVCAWDPAYLYNCRFFRCNDGIQIVEGEISLFNVLFSECDAPIFYTGVYAPHWVNAINVTADKGGHFVQFIESTNEVIIPPDWYSVYQYERCLFTRFFYSPINDIGGEGYAYSCYEQSNTLCYTSAAAANYYLATNSPYRNVGTTNTPLDFSEMTTYAPQDGGYPDTDALDIGYHYPVNEDSDHDGIPDWWMWSWFGNYTHNGNDLDARGNTLLFDYQNGDDPIDVAFSLASTNDYVNHTNVSLQVEVTAGRPACYAVIVNGSATTNWLPFSTTNLSVNLGTTDGVYNVEVGLIGSGEDAMQEWQQYAFYLDRVAPHLTITNPILAGAAGTVIKPYLQLQGFADKPLASLSYDISNAFGLATNLDVFVNDQYFDTNKFDFTTNYFQAYDVPLATNGNAITLRVTDRAGNTTTTNFNVVLDYTDATNPPIVKLIWPEDNMAIYGSSFTLRGTMSDETGTVRAQVVDGAGNTNTVDGLVERNGTFWVENLPLTTNGNHVVTITATDAAGNMTTTNITVFESEVVLTIDSTPTGDDLYKPTGTVSGTVSEESWEVYVNGMRVNVDTNANASGIYNWSADNVPIYGRGTATFDAVALPSGAAPPPANVNTNKEFEARMEVATYHIHHYWYEDGPWTWPWGTGDDWSKDVTSYLLRGNDGWAKVCQGEADDKYYDDDDGNNNSPIYEVWQTIAAEHYTWNETNELTVSISYHNGVASGSNCIGSVAQGIKDVPDSFEWGPEYFADEGQCQWVWPLGGGYEELTVGAKTELKLYTGGKAKVARKNLFCIQCSGTKYLDPVPRLYGPILYGSATISPDQLEVFGKKVGADGKLWIVQPDNAEPLVSLTAPGKKHYYADASQAKYKLHIDANTHNLDNEKPKFCVGQKVTFTGVWDIDPGAASTDYIWNFSSKYVNHSSQANSHSSVNYDIDLSLLNTAQPYAWWYSDGDKNAYLHEVLHFSNGQRVTLSVSGQFIMFKPSVSMVDPHYHGTPTVIWERPYYSWPSGAIQLGVQGGANNMSYLCRVTSADFAGEAKITQICNIDATGLGGSYSGALDGGDPYTSAVDRLIPKNPNPTGNIGILNLDDAPDANDLGGSLWTISMDDSFVDYVMFNPDPSGSGIYVTLAKITWDVSASATFPSTTITQNSDKGPHGPTDSNEFPTWTTIK